ncbi:unnamed protein product [Closterium sp. NIES-53]
MSLLPFLFDAEHISPKETISDHGFAIQVALKVDDRARMGHVLWRLQASMSQQPGVRQIIEETLQRIEVQDGRSFELLVSRLTVRLRAYTRQEKKRLHATYTHLISAVAVLRQEVLGNPGCTWRRSLLDGKEAMLKEYLAWQQERLHLMAGLYRELIGEISSKQLLGLVKARKSRTRILEVKVARVVVSDSRKVLAAASKFFRDIFGRDRRSVFEGWTPTLARTLQEEEASGLDADWTEEEVKSAFVELAKNKSPGSDGLPKEFFEANWDLLGRSFMALVRDFTGTGALSGKVKEAVTILLHKKGEKDQLSNYRPITLLSFAYKILAKVIVDRINKVLHRVISPQQYGFIRARRLTDGVALVADITDAAKNGGEDWYLLLVDFKKAFDSVSRDFIFHVLDRMGFPSRLVTWIRGQHLSYMGYVDDTTLALQGKEQITEAEMANGYIQPVMTFQAQVYPPPASVWKVLEKLIHNFVSGNKAMLDRVFLLWSTEMLYTPRNEGGLGVHNPNVTLSCLAARRVGLMMTEANRLKRELMTRAADLPMKLDTFTAHDRLLRHREGRSQRWKQTCELFMKSPLSIRTVVVTGAEVAKERLVLTEPSWWQELKSMAELTEELGGKGPAKLALKAFAAAPADWKEALLTPCANSAVWGTTSVTSLPHVPNLEGGERVVSALKRALRMLNPLRPMNSLEDLLFRQAGTSTAFPKATIIAITLHQFFTETTPGGELVVTRTGEHLATFTWSPRSGLYTLATESAQVAASGHVAALGQLAVYCSCRLLTHQTLLWHHRVGHPSLPCLRGMHSRLLVFGLPRSRPPLPRLLALPCLPCVEGRQRAAPHSSLPPTTAPLQTLHMDVARFQQDLQFLHLHSDRGNEFSSRLLEEFRRVEGITQSLMLPASPQQNGIAERRMGLIMEFARTSMIHAAAPHFLWSFEVRYATHELNL